MGFGAYGKLYKMCSEVKCTAVNGGKSWRTVKGIYGW
jgi:hypothetical protein